jgi:hypothetical protein
MALKAPIPFQQILTIAKTLTPEQKDRLRKELAEKPKKPKKLSDFTALLLRGPVFTKKQIETMEENRKSITIWRTKK